MAQAETLRTSVRLTATKPAKTLPWRLWLRRHQTRKQLKALLRDDPNRLLRDLGLHSMAVQAELDKWFWQS